MNYLLRTLGFWIGGFRVLHSGFLYVGGRFMGSWGFWRGRFRWVSGVTALDRGTRVLAREVVEVMERIEREDVG